MTIASTTDEQPVEIPPKRSVPWRKILSVVALGLLIYVGRRYWGDLPKLLEVSPWYLAAILAISLVNRFLMTEIFRQSLSAIGFLIGRIEAFHLLILRGYSGLFIPRSGFGTTGLYLKKRYGVRFASYTALLLPIAMVQCIVVGTLGLAGIVLLWQRYQIETPWEIVAIFAASLILSGTALSVRLEVPDSWPGRIAHFFRGLSESWHKLSRNRSLLWRLVGLQLIATLTRAARLQVAFWGIDLDSNFTGVMIASLLADLAFFFSVTPGNLGFREAAIVYGASVTGATKAEALAAAFLDRLIMVVSLAIIAQYSLIKVPGLKSAPAETDDAATETRDAKATG